MTPFLIMYGPAILLTVVYFAATLLPARPPKPRPIEVETRDYRPYHG